MLMDNECIHHKAPHVKALPNIITVHIFFQHGWTEGVIAQFLPFSVPMDP